MGSRMALWSFSGVLGDSSEQLLRRTIVCSREIMNYDKLRAYYILHRDRRKGSWKG